MSSLLGFLSQARSVVFRPPHSRSKTFNFTIVLGNPSADLDSFICAVLYSYYHWRSSKNADFRFYVPLLNLPTTISSELWRLRPEFGTALRLASKDSPWKSEKAGNGDKGEDRRLFEHLITIADIRTNPFAQLQSLLPPPSYSPDVARDDENRPKTEVVLVDHNALSIAAMDKHLLANRFEVTGCVDHHNDESFVPKSASPRKIHTGIGSCTSLVVQHLREGKHWPDNPKGADAEAELEMAKLALTAIFIDTANLTDQGKVSDTDRDAVSFLESRITSVVDSSKESSNKWNQEAFYKEISTSKANSLDLLTIQEILERDYKQWTESSRKDEQLNVGVSSVVKPLAWLISKAESPSNLLEEIQTYVSRHNLPVYGIMTTSNSSKGEFQRELMLLAFGGPAMKALDKFESRGMEDFKLETWSEKKELVDLVQSQYSNEAAKTKIWWQRDLAKSRKQVAPLLRKAVTEM